MKNKYSNTEKPCNIDIVTGSGLPVHIFDKGRVKTKCGINTNKVKGISYVQHGFEFTGKKENLCKECLSHYL